MQISSYLKSRRHNSHLLNKLAEEVFDPIIGNFNEDHDRAVNVTWCMSAKYQSITMNFEMEDGEELSPELIEAISEYGVIGSAISNWFAAEVDEDDCYGKRYVSIDIGL